MVRFRRWSAEAASATWFFLARSSLIAGFSKALVGK